MEITNIIGAKTREELRWYLTGQVTWTFNLLKCFI